MLNEYFALTKPLERNSAFNSGDMYKGVPQKVEITLAVALDKGLEIPKSPIITCVSSLFKKMFLYVYLVWNIL